MFETEDLVSQKNEKHVVLTLLEVARRGAKIGMLAPMVSWTELFPWTIITICFQLVQFEQEIDQELAREEMERKKLEKEEKERVRQLKEEEKARKKKEREEREREREEERAKKKLEKEEKEREAAAQAAEKEAALRKMQEDSDMFPSLAVEVQDDTAMDDVEGDSNNLGFDGHEFDDLEDMEEEEDEEEEEEDEEEEEEEEEEEDEDEEV